MPIDVRFRDRPADIQALTIAATQLKGLADAYISAERRGTESLRRFLLDLDAKEANGSSSGQTIGEVIQLYFAFNAPDTGRTR